MVTFARCAFVYAMLNITLGGNLDTRRNIYIEHLRIDVRPETYIYIINIYYSENSGH